MMLTHIFVSVHCVSTVAVLMYTKLLNMILFFQSHHIDNDKRLSHYITCAIKVRPDSTS